MASCYVGYKVHTELLTLALTARSTTVSTLRNITRLSVHIHLGLSAQNHKGAGRRSGDAVLVRKPMQLFYLISYWFFVSLIVSSYSQGPRFSSTVQMCTSIKVIYSVHCKQESANSIGFRELHQAKPKLFRRVFKGVPWMSHIFASICSLNSRLTTPKEQKIKLNPQNKFWLYPFSGSNSHERKVNGSHMSPDPHCSGSCSMLKCQVSTQNQLTCQAVESVECQTQEIIFLAMTLHRSFEVGQERG